MNRKSLLILVLVGLLLCPLPKAWALNFTEDFTTNTYKDAEAYNNLGYLYAKRGRKLDEAIRLIKKALSLKPENGNFLDSLGWAYYKKGMYDEALEQLEKAASLIPNNPEIYEHLATVYKKKGMKEKAKRAWEKAAIAKAHKGTEKGKR